MREGAPGAGSLQSARHLTDSPRADRRRIQSKLYPCRCLWRGFVHTTKTVPRRRTILQCSQIRLTLARTFITTLRSFHEALDKVC
jgi:hypothetical protein